MAKSDLLKNLRRAERSRKLVAFALTLPLLVFFFFILVLPMGSTLLSAVSSRELRESLPETTRMLNSWDGRTPPDEEMFAILVRDMARSYQDKTIASAATRLNQESSGFRSAIMRTGRQADNLTAPYKESVVTVDAEWGNIERWQVMKAAAVPVTARYLLQVLDLEQTRSGTIQKVAPDQAIYITYLVRTFWISFVVTLICLAVGYPLAFFTAHARPFVAKMVLAAVLLPFWVSVLVRTAAWIVLLQKEGLINKTLIALGLVDAPLQLIFNRFGVYVAMVHVLLPFFVLPAYNTMKHISPLHMRAAGSLGARPWAAFVTVYLPQSLPGVSAGLLLVFILALGYYITPALVGGAGDQMLSYLVTEFALQLGNWGMAAAAATLLLVSTFIVYIIFRQVLGTRGFAI